LSVKRAAKQSGIVLTLGYNTGLFNLLFRLKGKHNIINMDGIEWKRDKWKWHEKTWLYLNERASCLIGNHLVADHPEIKNHLTTRIANNKVSMIPYGAREVVTADSSLLKIFNIESKKYAIIIARAEPENSILEIVQAFSYSYRDIKLVVLGKYDEGNLYHSSVLSAASNQVEFIGAVYDHAVLDALRFHSVLYIHGHTVGGTNPSLIEALGSGQPILAHNNKFNRWVAGDNAVFFKDKRDCQFQLDSLLNNPQRLGQMSEFSRERFNERFTWSNVLGQYENLLNKWL
jgi:glycosyltransferase involved in cell wall biosynthesis